MYLSYSAYKLYRTCPRAYYHRYLAKTVMPERENKVNSLYGTVVGLLFERFYADRIWQRTGIEGILTGMAETTLDQAIAREEKSGAVDFADPKSNYKSRAALLDDVKQSVPRGLAIIRHHRLIGRDAQAEVKLDIDIGPHRVGGRADFIMTRVGPGSDLVILDGKGSKWREKYVDATQLRWYALLYQKHHGRLPDRLGFVFWRSEPDDAMDWVDINPEEIVALERDILAAMTNMEREWAAIESTPERERLPLLMEHFPAVPDRFGCKLCSYAPVCPEGRSLLRPAGDMGDATLSLSD